MAEVDRVAGTEPLAGAEPVRGGCVLEGRRILVLRPEAQADDLAGALEALGATPVVVPAIRIEPLLDWDAVDRALDRIGSYDWVLFTSVNGVAAVIGRMAEGGIGPEVFRRDRSRPGTRHAGAGSPAIGEVAGIPSDALQPSGPWIGAIGPATEQALERAGIAVDWVPSRFTTEALAAELPPVSERPGRRGMGSVCVFRADVAGPELDELLSARGFELHRVDAYRTVPTGSERIAAALASGVDAVAFTSASIARAFAEAASEHASADGSSAPHRGAAPGGGGPLPLVCCIGPATARACRAAGLPVDCEAAEHTIPGLVRAIAGLLGQPGA
jgi:uroporphyrinogen III methyltransferase/synthase